MLEFLLAVLKPARPSRRPAVHALRPGIEEGELHVQGLLQYGCRPRFTALDVRIAWKVSRAMERSLTGMKLLDPPHPERGAPAARAEVERSGFLKLLWRM